MYSIYYYINYNSINIRAVCESRPCLLRNDYIEIVFHEYRVIGDLAHFSLSYTVIAIMYRIVQELLYCNTFNTMS